MEYVILFIALMLVIAGVFGTWLMVRFASQLQTGHERTMQHVLNASAQQQKEAAETMRQAFEQIKEVSVEGVASARAGIGEVGKALNPPLLPPQQQTETQQPIITREQLQEVYDGIDWTDGMVGGERPGTAPLGPGEEIPGIGLGSGPPVEVQPVDFGEFDRAGEEFDG